MRVRGVVDRVATRKMLRKIRRRATSRGGVRRDAHTICARMGAYGRVWARMGAYGRVWARMGAYGFREAHIPYARVRPYGRMRVCAHMGVCWRVCGHAATETCAVSLSDTWPHQPDTSSAGHVISRTRHQPDTSSAGHVISRTRHSRLIASDPQHFGHVRGVGLTLNMSDTWPHEGTWAPQPHT
jgi:hypothetical protein